MLAVVVSSGERPRGHRDMRQTELFCKDATGELRGLANDHVGSPSGYVSRELGKEAIRCRPSEYLAPHPLGPEGPGVRNPGREEFVE